MKIGLVGYQGSGKSTLFEWLTGVAADPALSHQSQSANTPVPEDRVEPLCAIYHPKKITLAGLELVDTPGLSRTHEGNAGKLIHIREAGCLVLVVAAFGGGDAAGDMQRFDEDFLIADMELVARRIERLKEQVKKPKPTRDQELAELAALESLLVSLESGKRIHESGMSEDQIRATRSFQLLTEKPRMVVVSLADEESDAEKFTKLSTPQCPVVAVPVGLRRELARMTEEERAEFENEMSPVGMDRAGLLRAIMDASSQMLYFTAGDKEVRTWMIRKGGTALEAAENIHTDLARGFIRAEVMTCPDLIRLGSEREIKANNLLRSEPKDYVVKDGDILHIRFSV